MSDLSASSSVAGREIASGIESDSEHLNRRETRDRRQRHPLRLIWRFAFGGRRKSIRRRSDLVSARTVLDWYRPSLLFFVVSTYVLSAIDAFLTLTLLGLDVAVEANPFMEILLKRDVALFVGVKSFITGVGLVSLALYSKLRLFTHIQTEFLIYLLFTIYSALVGYEIYLLNLS